jgi:cardiolipin synthase
MKPKADRGSSIVRVVAVWIVAIVITCGAAGCGTKAIHYQLESKLDVADPQFARTVGNLLGPSLVGGNRLQTLRNGDQIFPAMLDAIRGARHTITFETYIYWSGEIGKTFANALAERARAGVKVHLLLDWEGSGKIDKAYLSEMRDAGVQIAQYHPVHLYDPSTIRQLDHRTHRKLLIVDGKVGFTGGVGIADEWLGNADRPDHWRDNHYRIEGPAVGQLQGVFMDNWMQTTGQVLEGEEYFPALPAAGDEYAQVFKSAFTGGSESMELLFLVSLAAAGADVRMENSYFVPDAQTVQELVKARQRGVRIQLIVPGPKIDQKIVRKASRALWGDLLKAGVEIYEYQPTMIHCKLMIVDGQWVSIGSSNLDNRSFRINDEANVNVLDVDFAAEQIRVFEEDKQKARKVTYENWARRPWGEKVSEHLASLLVWEL